MKPIAASAVSANSATGTARSGDLSLAHFIAPNHPSNAGVFTPFAEWLAEASGGKMTVRQYPGGALNSVPSKLCSILLDCVADIAFAVLSFFGDLFPKTNSISLPNIFDSFAECTKALRIANTVLEKEYDAKILALRASSPPILPTKNKPVRAPEDLKGMKIRVASKRIAPFAEALGASAVAQPVDVTNRNLSTIAIDASGIDSFMLNEPANYLTTYFPGSGIAFALLMNKNVYDSPSEREKGWGDSVVDKVYYTLHSEAAGGVIGMIKGK